MTWGAAYVPASWERRLANLCVAFAIVLVFIGLFLLVGCESELPSQPSKPEPSASPVAVVEPVSMTPPAVVPSDEGRRCEFLGFGQFTITNLTEIPQTYYYWSTDVDQSLTQGPAGPFVVNPGATLPGQGTATCSQVDVSHDSDHVTSHNVLCAAWYGTDGRPQGNPHAVNWAACKRTITTIPQPLPSPTPCAAVPQFWNESGTQTPTQISFRGQVSGPGTWRLALYATSDLSEYLQNKPDFTKDQDFVTIICDGGRELKVSYAWAGHPSRYWWGVLTLGNAVMWKSAAVEK